MPDTRSYFSDAPPLWPRVLSRLSVKLSTHGKRPQGKLESFARAAVLTLLACAATTAVAAWLLRVFDLANVVMLFLVTVVFIALKLGRAAGALASFVCVASFDFFFVEPRFSFAVGDSQYLFTFALMLFVSLVISQLAARLLAEAKSAAAGERRAEALARIATDLAAAMDASQIASICRTSIAPTFKARASLLLPDANNVLFAVSDGDFVDLAVAQWSFAHPLPSGLDARSDGEADAVYLPLAAPEAIRGVLALLPLEGSLTRDREDRRLLLACCSSIAIALERTHFVAVAQKIEMRMGGERLRNALLASVSHDLKTPLTVIRGLAETLEWSDQLSKTDQRDLSRSIRLQAEELQRFVSNILDLARMQGDGVRLKSDWHLLNEVVGTALGRAAAALQDRQLRIELPANLPLIEIDAVMFERVLVNLLDNAAKYTKAGSTIRLSAAVQEDMMSLLVEDDGPGLPPGDPEELFVAFSRGRAESAIPGVGLGLALCRTITEAHGGTIRACRSALGGAAFQIRLPLGQPPLIALEDDAYAG